MKQKINFYLEGGGSKCSYQYGFLKHILTNKYFLDNFEVEAINCISFGAVICYLLLHELDVPNTLMDELISDNILKRSISFPLLESIPIIGRICDIVWLVYSLSTFGLFKTDVVENYLRKTIFNNYTMLAKMNIYVYNITRNKTEIINGTHPSIIEYILAGMTCWLIFPPKKILLLTTECVCDESCNCCKLEIYCQCPTHQYNEFMDIGFVHTIPLNIVNPESINCFLLTNEINKNILVSKGDNLLEYLFNIIDHTSNNHQNLLIDKHDLLNKYHIIVNKPLTKTIENDKEKTKLMVKKGKMISKVYLNHLSKSKLKTDPIMFQFM